MPSEPDLERLYDEHAPTVFAFLMNLTRSEADAGDCLQDLFIKLASKPDLLAGVRNERAFLLRLAHNLVVDLIRRGRTRERHHQALADQPVELIAEGADPDEAEFRRELTAALAELPPDQRAVVHLKL